MASPEPSTALTTGSPSDVLVMLRSLPDRLDDTALALVSSIAAAPVPALPSTTPEHFAACLRSLSILPRRADDDTTGEQRAKLYARLLSDYPADALSFMTRAALERCQWFPSIAECKAILAEWRRADDAVHVKAVAWSKGEAERRARFEDLCKSVPSMSIGEINALPHQTKMALENRCLLSRLSSGLFVPRPCRAARALAVA